MQREVCNTNVNRVTLRHIVSQLDEDHETNRASRRGGSDRNGLPPVQRRGVQI